MGLLTTIGIAIGLALDALAVAIAVGARVRPLTFRHYFRLSFHFGLFQALMPILGWYLGSRIESLIASYDHWIAFALLFVIGTRMLYESFRSKNEIDAKLSDPTRKWSLVLLSIATSIDAFAVGLSIALLRVSILAPSLIIGLVALTFTGVGLLCGRRLGDKFGKQAEFLGGALLIAIGLRIVLVHAS